MTICTDPPLLPGRSAARSGWLTTAVQRLVAAALLALPLASPADTVASLLGDFTINQFCGVHLAPGVARVHYTVVFGQLPALRELHRADANADGVTTQAERDAYVQRLAPDFAAQLHLTVDGRSVPLQATAWTSSLPAEQTGFSMRLDIDFEAPLPAGPAASGSGTAAELTLDNRNYDGQIGWHEMVVTADPPLSVFDTDAHGQSLTDGLRLALQSLPASGPLDERRVHLRWRDGPLPAGAQGPRLRDPTEMAMETTKVSSTSAATARGAGGAPAIGAQRNEQAGAGSAAQNGPAWLQVQTRRLIDLISSPGVAPQTFVLALLGAVLLGALHAFSPGHGKSIVGAYLVGSRGTPRHAVFLGLTVTLTHTLVVFALGLATLVASRYVVPQRLFPILGLISGLLVFGMGVVMLAQRWRGALRAWQPHVHRHDHDHDLDLDHGHHHGDHHGHARAHAGALHSHAGGVPHSHLPPGAQGEPVTWRGLLALGISGGLLPCPSAMVLLLACVALQKTWLGLVLVAAFSVGLAVTLSGVGMAFLYARNRFAGQLQGGRWAPVMPLMPVLSAAVVAGLGAVLCYGALAAPAV